MTRVTRSARVWAMAVMLGGLAFGPPTWARVIPPLGRVDPRVRTVRYQSGQVYELHGAVGVATDIVLQPGERLVGYAGGDLGAVTVSVTGSHVFVKPKAAPVHTNLILLTRRRVYRFDYDVPDLSASAAGIRGSGERVIYALKFTYTKALKVARASPISRTPSRRQPPKPVRAINRAYAYAGSTALKPRRAWDDGVETHLIFGPQQAIPAIFVRHADGTEGLVNFTVVASGVIVHRVAEHLILRLGRLRGCVWNQAYRGPGARLPTGSAAPGLKRALKAVPR